MSKRFYSTFNYPNSKIGDKTLLTGIRRKRNSRNVYISGFYVKANGDTTSFVYKGTVHGEGKFYNLNYPMANTVTNLYGPNNSMYNNVRVVGNYNNEVEGNVGCLYDGPPNGMGTWTRIALPHSINTICHSTMGRLVVGNYNRAPYINTSKAFVYDIMTKKYYDIVKKDVLSISVYGIWHNSDSSYTICGGYINEDSVIPHSIAYVADWNNDTHTISNWQSYHYNNNPSLVTHFDGITGRSDGGYNLTGDDSPIGDIAFFAQISRKHYRGKFSKKAKWYPVSYPNALVTSGNSVLDNIVIGVYSGDQSENMSVNGFISNMHDNHICN